MESTQQCGRHRLTAAAALIILVIAAPATPQSAANATFDVASVKPNKSGTTQANAGIQPNGVNLVNLPLRVIIQLAYGIAQPSRLVGAPGWSLEERFDIVARAAGTTTPDQIRLMLQKLLADRFKLVVRRENRPLDAYALVLARKDGKLGEHLRVTASNCSLPPTAPGGRIATPSAPAPTPMCGLRAGGPGRLTLEGSPIGQFANLLTRAAGRTIIDKTGLTGRYDIDLTYAPEREVAGIAADGTAAIADANAPSLFTALQEQLGLKLESSQEPEEVLVVESVDRPSED